MGLQLVTGETAGQRRATVPVDALLDSDSPRIDGENAERVQTLARIDSPLPPILVHRDTMRVVDGMHRLKAARLRGDTTIDVEFFEGGEVEAFARAVWLNITHGLPLSQADRTAAAERILAARPYWSDRRIAVGVGLAAGTVAAIRRRSTGQNGQLNTRVGRDGRVRPLQATEGRLRASQVIAANPGASLREIAEQAGIATATAKDVRDRIRQGQDPLPSKSRPQQEGPAPAEALPQLAGGRRVTRTPAAEIGLQLPSLCKDPSLRTEAGRMLLQLLGAHSLGDEAKWLRLARSVPAHRADLLAQAARRCADHWLRLANELETRSM
ncbi:ParB/RepB/Spo0J family partition protein [Streptomyces sp. S.PB5]|uniref:ParB/RepB/Spo0J family partition protein n=1 Tax=Streptomyces sp. S.PB5 TaxID=3020844 RepID=UPI0025AED196|nr:ParB/RepB/Spo0J family partition protein [Streptomyces sp. S.PB5]MDN3028492.1 ParB/RepB/Spo0J family partition protein [Streptomyces sp. S.PB5]